MTFWPRAAIGGGVVFDTNELLRLFERSRIVRYEDTEGIGDFGLRTPGLFACRHKIFP